MLGALQDVALAYLRRDGDAIPFWRMASLPVDGLRGAGRSARRWASVVAATEALPGAGSLPGVAIPSVGVAVDGDRTAALRAADPPIVARVGDGRTMLDLRTVDPVRRRPPGRGAGRRSPVRVVATAGHVDHGKSSLVLALTGTDPDRFDEEKRRGLTIDLGFAHTTLPSGAGITFVDVPGHVRFLKNMLAGVGAVDACLFVVAATEGWKPQSEEHLRILELLGVRHGVIALTKVDLGRRRVAPSWPSSTSPTTSPARSCDGAESSRSTRRLAPGSTTLRRRSTRLRGDDARGRRPRPAAALGRPCRSPPRAPAPS